MSVSLARVVTTADLRPVTCRVPPDLLGDLEAYTAAYEARHGATIPLPDLLLALAQETLRKDRVFLQWRQAQAKQQHAAASEARDA